MENKTDLTELIIEYYEKRGLVWPSFDDAIKFVVTELGEVLEVDLSRKDWVRNNPENKPTFSKEALSTELGDVIFMLMVAGYVEGVNPIQSLKDKINRKLEKLNGPQE
jgi:NTP pyrophosphatase (non-canonical NTP hydrolase)